MSESMLSAWAPLGGPATVTIRPASHQPPDLAHRGVAQTMEMMDSPKENRSRGPQKRQKRQKNAVSRFIFILGDDEVILQQ